MSGYFHGWKRKVGAATLCFACTFAIGWTKSLIGLDWVVLPAQEQPHNIVGSWSSALVWLQEESSPTPMWSFNRYRNSNDQLYINDRLQWRWRCAGFGIAVQNAGQGSGMVVVPYWSLVIPLTSLSAWLLLSNRRQLSQTEKQG